MVNEISVRTFITNMLENDQRDADKLEGAKLAYQAVLRFMDEEHARNEKALDDYYAASRECDRDNEAPEVPAPAEPAPCGCDLPLPELCGNPNIATGWVDDSR